MQEWFCKKCGHCCKHQYTRMELNKDEIELFPKNSYLPYIGYGDSKSNVTVLLYKLIPKRCPLYNDDIGCTIYEDRPIICRRFPFNKDPNNPHGLGLDNGCKNAPQGQGMKIVTKENMEDVFPLIEKFNKQTEEMTKKFFTSKFWLCKNFKWRLITQKKLDRIFNKS